MDVARVGTLLWLGLFGLDAGVGLVQAAASLAGLGSAMGGAVGVTGLLLFLGTSLYLAVWVGAPRTPWWILVLVAYLGWEAGGLLPLPAVSFDLESTARWGALIQVVLVVPVAVLVARDAVLADRPKRSFLITALRSLCLPALLLVAALIQVWLMALSLSVATGGFARVDSTGLETGARECSRGDKTIHLVGAIHVGEQEGYDGLLASIPTDALMLAEGVTDEGGRLGQFSYDRLAEAIGLVPQRPSQAEPGSGDAEGDGRFRMRRADVDIGTFDERTIGLLKTVGVALESEDPMGAWVRQATQLDITEGTFEALRADILDGRNATLLAAVDEELSREDRLLVPWGALHLRGIREGVEERGFSCGDAQYVRMLRWSTIVDAVRKR